MSLDFSAISPYLHMLITGAKVTLQASLLAVFFGSVFGTLVGALRVVPIAPVRSIAAAYIYIIRGTPLLIQLFLIYFGLPSLGLNLPAFAAGIIGLSIIVRRCGDRRIEAVPDRELPSLGASYLENNEILHYSAPGHKEHAPGHWERVPVTYQESSLLSTRDHRAYHGSQQVGA